MRLAVGAAEFWATSEAEKEAAHNGFAPGGAPIRWLAALASRPIGRRFGPAARRAGQGESRPLARALAASNHSAREPPIRGAA